MAHKIEFNFDKKKVSVTTAEFLLGIYKPNAAEAEIYHKVECNIILKYLLNLCE